MRVAVVVYSGLLGLVVGSFLNVVVERVPKGESVVRPRSHCPRCGAMIAGRDNVPLVSWIVLRGRCRSCGEPIPLRYPLVEAGTGAAFVATALHFAWSPELAVFLVLFSGLIALSAVDLREHRLPVAIFYPVLGADGAVLVVTAAVRGQWHRLLVAVACGAVWFAVFFAVNWIRPKALGFGDVRLVALLGLCLGWLGVSEVFVGFFAGDVLALFVAIVMLATGRMDRRTPIPFGAFLAAGCAVAVFAGSPIVGHLRGLR